MHTHTVTHSHTQSRHITAILSTLRNIAVCNNSKNVHDTNIILKIFYVVIKMFKTEFSPSEPDGLGIESSGD